MRAPLYTLSIWHILNTPVCMAERAWIIRVSYRASAAKSTTLVGPSVPRSCLTETQPVINRIWSINIEDSGSKNSLKDKDKFLVLMYLSVPFF